MVSWEIEGVACFVPDSAPQILKKFEMPADSPFPAVYYWVLDGNWTPFYRAWNGSDHFYTANQAEYQGLSAQYRREGIACWIAKSQVDNTVPFFRLYKGRIDNHIYTTSETEKKALIDDGYNYEKIAGYVYSAPILDAEPLYRAYHQKIKDHFFTLNLEELRYEEPGQGKVNLTLARFRCIQQEDWVGKDEAYLWVYGLLVDSNTLSTGQYIKKMRIAKNNIGGGIRERRTREIPAAVGAVYEDQEIAGIFGRFLVGVIVVAWEGDNTPGSTVVSTYDGVADILNESIQRRIASLDMSSLTDSDMDALKKDIKDFIKSKFSSAVHWYDPFSWDWDDYIGFKSEIVTGKTDESAFRPLELHFRGDGAHYRINGLFYYNRV